MIDKASKILVAVVQKWVVMALFLVIAGGCTQHHVVWRPPESGGLVLDSAVASFYNSWRGTPYLLGGEGRRGIDCSAFMQQAYSSLYHLNLPRTTREQLTAGRNVPFTQLIKGDLLVFKTGWKSYHVGMYLGANHFLHAGESTGVAISKLTDGKNSSGGYWRRHYLGARRLLRQ